MKRLTKFRLPAAGLVAVSIFVLTGFAVKETPGKYVGGVASDTVKDERLTISIPPEGRLINGKPVGEGWTNLIATLEGWSADPQFWSLDNGSLHGDYSGGKFHNFAWTKKRYANFELQAVVKLDGEHPNSGVCIRLHPVDTDNVPGYQIDMGIGYWASLWEEKRAGMVQKFPDDLAAELVKSKDWNHYYIRARNHHIQAWLNGVKTIDTVHVSGFEDGAIGFQLCHGNAHTILDVRTLYVRELK